MSVRVPLDGVDAKLNIASMAPTEQRQKANRMRGLKSPDWEAGFFFIKFSCVTYEESDSGLDRTPPWQRFFAIPTRIISTIISADRGDASFLPISWVEQRVVAKGTCSAKHYHQLGRETPEPESRKIS